MFGINVYRWSVWCIGVLVLGSRIAGAEPSLLREIDISAGGAGQRMLLGDVTGDGRLEMVMMQGDRLDDDRYIGHEVNCLTAFDLNGKQLWQIGDPSIGEATGSDIPAQVYDIDQDGFNEVLACMDGKFRVFDGRTGEEEYAFEYPHPNAHDCIVIANLTGKDKPQDIILKDRYNQVWALDRFGRLLWTHRGNTGHFPWPYDFDGDGKDELICGYDYLDHDGKKIWTADQGGHADCVWVGNVDGNAENGMEIVMGGDDVTVYTWKGELVWRNNEPIEPQNIVIGDFRKDLPGLEIGGQDRRDRGTPGEEAVFLINGRGQMETYVTRSGWRSILYSTQNWAGKNEDFMMIWKSPHSPALYNGKLEPAVTFPQDGYMMSADLNGDGPREMVLFTDRKASVYGYQKVDLSKAVIGVPAPRPQEKKDYLFTRYWGGEYIMSDPAVGAQEQTPRMLTMERRPGAHDPVMIKENDTYYMFTTGRNIPIMTSTNMVDWERGGSVFEQMPEWVAEEIPKARDIWAPDISYFNGLYHLYYSLSSFGVNESAIGLVVNKTLDQDSPDYKWEDRGMVVRSRTGETDFNAIDPNIVVVSANEIWLNWGSFWGGIMMRKIDPQTGKAAKDDASYYNVANRARSFEHQTPPVEGAIEAPFIVRHGDYWYLFASFDFCCRGANSTYNVRVGRSKSITGPYLDKDNVSMLDGGGSIVIEATTDNWKGPGHQAVFREGDQDYLLFHAYDGRNGRSQLHISTMVWEDGWPHVATLP